MSEEMDEISDERCDAALDSTDDALESADETALLVLCGQGQMVWLGRFDSEKDRNVWNGIACKTYRDGGTRGVLSVAEDEGKGGEEDWCELHDGGLFGHSLDGFE